MTQQLKSSEKLFYFFFSNLFKTRNKSKNKETRFTEDKLNCFGFSENILGLAKWCSLLSLSSAAVPPSSERTQLKIRAVYYWQAWNCDEISPLVYFLTHGDLFNFNPATCKEPYLFTYLPFSL